MFRTALSAVCLLTLAACGAKDTPASTEDVAVAATETENAEVFTIENAYVRKPLIGQNVTAAYFDLTSTSDDKAMIVAVYADKAETAELHMHVMEGSQMSMRRVDSIDIPAHSTVGFQPMSNHVMLFEVDPTLEDGDMVTLYLDIFSDGNTKRITFEAPVRPL